MKYVFYILGIIILTFGISVTIQSDLGTSPFDALIVGLSVHAGLTVGSWEIIIAFLLICCNSMLKRQRPEFSGMITAFITGIGIDMWLFFLHRFIVPEPWYEKAGCFAIGLVVIGIGTAAYLHTNFAPIPVDRLTLIIRELTGRSIFFSRTVIYFLFFILALILKGPVGIGTLFTVCLGGLILHFFMPITGRWIDGILTVSQKQKDKKKWYN
ncbi:YitT family protein [Bacillus siamensis]|uniref:YczE/YyaS/YitT family protein n=1 Tax=Bacillus siamensis TaxID=659243 RepID=UPI0018E619E1|nr:YitT family protein [Bacillus siamensis]QQD81535.1 YitT family protein [Bacillus siamensis]